MSEKIVQLNEEVIKGQLKELVRGSVEETLNELLDHGAGNVRSGGVLVQAQIHPYPGDSVSTARPLQIGAEIEQISLLRLYFLLVAACSKPQQQDQGQDQRNSSFHSVSPLSLGMRMVKTVPPPIRGRASMVPPRRRTVSLTMDSPRPVPPAARERALSTR